MTGISGVTYAMCADSGQACLGDAQCELTATLYWGAHVLHHCERQGEERGSLVLERSICLWWPLMINVI